MDAFYPFIHTPEKKKEEPQPLYVELYPSPPESPKKEEQEETHVIVIELL